MAVQSKHAPRESHLSGSKFQVFGCRGLGVWGFRGVGGLGCLGFKVVGVQGFQGLGVSRAGCLEF